MMMMMVSGPRCFVCIYVYVYKSVIDTHAYRQKKGLMESESKCVYVYKYIIERK